MRSHSEILGLGLQHRNFGGDTIQPIIGRKHEEKGGSDKKITQKLAVGILNV